MYGSEFCFFHTTSTNTMYDQICGSPNGIVFWSTAIILVSYPRLISLERGCHIGLLGSCSQVTCAALRDMAPSWEDVKNKFGDVAKVDIFVVKNQNPTGTGLNFFEAASFKHSTSTVLSIEGASCNHSIAALFSVLTIQRRLKNSQVQLCFIQGKDEILNQFIAHRNETYSDLFISHLTLEDTTLTEPQKKQEF